MKDSDKVKFVEKHPSIAHYYKKKSNHGEDCNCIACYYIENPERLKENEECAEMWTKAILRERSENEKKD